MSLLASTPRQIVKESFEVFYSGWLAGQENLLQELMSVMPDAVEQQRKLIEKVLCHYQKFLEEKSNVANADVFLLFSSPWLSSYERALFWIGDYKPSLILRLLNSAVKGLTAEQRERVERIKNETKRAEREVSEEMASVQESMASPRMVGLMRIVNAEIAEQESALDGLKKLLMKVSQRADQLRSSTMRTVVGILSPPQMVQLLAAMMHFQIRVRNWGLNGDKLEPSR